MPVQDTQTIAPGEIHWFNLIWAVLAIIGMIAVILSGHLGMLNFLHVASGLLWTGIDLFMGFVIGPINRQLPFEMRRAFSTRLTPKTLFLLPTLAIVTGTTGWYLARDLGLLALDYPAYWWVIAALVIVTLLSIQGIGILLPTQLRVYYEMLKPEPDRAKIGRLQANYFYMVALQGVMQVGIIVIMAKFRMGL